MIGKFQDMGLVKKGQNMPQCADKPLRIAKLCTGQEQCGKPYQNA